MSEVIVRKNIDGTEVKLGVLLKNNKKKVKVKTLIGKYCSYVGKTKGTGDRIVLFKGKILDQEGDLITVLFEDRYKYSLGEKHKVTLNKKYVTINI